MNIKSPLKIILLLTALFIVIILSSCSLDRKNPLDPVGNSSISIPGRVIGLTYSKITSPQNLIIVRWNRLSDVDGYYVYRGFSLYTKKERVGTIESNEITEFVDSSNILPGRRYFYWVSAYIEYPQGRIEGRLSDHIEVPF